MRGGLGFLAPPGVWICLLGTGILSEPKKTLRSTLWLTVDCKGYEMADLLGCLCRSVWLCSQSTTQVFMDITDLPRQLRINTIMHCCCCCYCLSPTATKDPIPSCIAFVVIVYLVLQQRTNTIMHCCCCCYCLTPTATKDQYHHALLLLLLLLLFNP